MGDEILTMHELAEPLKINEQTAYKLASWRFERQEWIRRKVEERQRE